jgi:glutathione S-transferase
MLGETCWTGNDISLNRTPHCPASRRISPNTAKLSAFTFRRITMSTFELFYSPGSASLVVHWLLLELGLPHTLTRVDMSQNQQKSPEYLKLNPAGVVPTLLIDGTAVSEAAAIAMHLADLGNSRLAPVPGHIERAHYYQWFCFCANTLQPAYRTWFYPTEPAGESGLEAAQAAAQVKIESAWARVDAHLANHAYLLGKQISAVDFMLTMLMRWSRNMPKPAHSWPNLANYAARMKALPSFQALYAREGLTEWA